MPISGTICPKFSTGPTPAPAGSSPGLVTVSGVTTSGIIQGGNASNESLPEFYRRALGLLALSGTDNAGGQIFTDAEVSGLQNLQWELSLRAADLEVGGSLNDLARVARANDILTASGELTFGT